MILKYELDCFIQCILLKDLQGLSCFLQQPPYFHQTSQEIGFINILSGKAGKAGDKPVG